MKLMKHPSATQYHNPDPDYIRSLVERTGMPHKQCAIELGISVRMLHYYLTAKQKPDGTLKYPCPYHVQYTLEGLAL